MDVWRVEKNGNYTTMSNHHLRDKALSLKAKGLLSQLLSLPDDWKLSLKGLVGINKESFEAIGTAVNELVKAGYIKRVRARGERGKIAGYSYTVYEKPPSPCTGFPHTDKPCTDEPCTENPHLLSTKGTKELKEPNTTPKPKSDKLGLSDAACEHLGRYTADNHALAVALASFLEMRRGLRAKNTDRAVQLLLSELDKLSDGDPAVKVQLVNQSTLNSWKGIFPLKNIGRQELPSRAGTCDPEGVPEWT